MRRDVELRPSRWDQATCRDIHRCTHAADEKLKVSFSETDRMSCAHKLCPNLGIIIDLPPRKDDGGPFSVSRVRSQQYDCLGFV